MKSPGERRLVPRFAFTTLCVFAAVAVSLWWVLTAIVAERTRSTAEEHAVFVTHSVIRPALADLDLGAPLRLGDPAYEALRDLIVSDVIGVQFPVERVNVWGSDGTLLFSDEPRISSRRSVPSPGLRSALAGRVVSASSDPNRPENAARGDDPSEILATYIPLSGIEDTTVVVEIDTDVAAAAVPVGRPFRMVGLALLGGLAAIYVVQLPLVRRLGRTLRAQNRKLHSLLQREQRTVEELRDLNRRQGEFLAVTSHELRTPLTSIAGYAKTLMQPAFDDDPSSRREFLHAIERQARRLGTLVENILAVTQVGESHPVVGTARVQEAVRAVLAEATAERVDVDVPDLPDVGVDGRLLELALGNLLDNALKFSPPGSRCRIGAHLEDDLVVVWVEDEGIGIDQQHIGRIFDRFYQVDSSSTRRHGGVGLGLHLVKSVVEGAGGSIEVESELGRGTRFTIGLPVSATSSDLPEHLPNAFADDEPAPASRS
jgi:signal transduction histidine kinase